MDEELRLGELGYEVELQCGQRMERKTCVVKKLIEKRLGRRK